MILSKKPTAYRVFVILVMVIVSFLSGAFLVYSKGAYDQFGYNYKARIFSAKADGLDRKIDGAYWGDPTYANDHIVMKWSKEWDEARFNGAAWNCDAWVSNEWNGKGDPNGSGEIWHYKIVWVGSELENSSCWREGGYAIWGEFEVIMSQGTVDNGHIWETLASPAGYNASHFKGME